MTRRLWPTVGLALLALTGCATDGSVAANTTSASSAVPPARGTAIDPADAVLRVGVMPCEGQLERRATAVAVADDLVVTVAHTFVEARTVELHEGGRNGDGDEGGATWQAEILWLDVERDIAVLRVDDVLPWLALGDAEDGAEVDVVSAAKPTIETKPAIILQHAAATLDGAGRRAALELEAEIQSGDSGAPVVAQGPTMVGMVFATARTADRGWAIAAKEIEAALAQPKDDPISLSC